MERSPVPVLALRAPKVPLLSLDTVWFQVAGTLCNLACRHCFISCGPGNRSHEMMSRAEVGRYLVEAADLGVKDLYFTGGEPFLNRELPGILEDALRIAPVTVLTNATLIDDRRAEELATLSRGARYSFEVRVSLDGLTPDTNDPIRGEGSFRTTIRGVEALHRAGFLPILTVAQTWSDEEDAALRERFHALLLELGITRPRVKVLPLFRVGRETERTRGYAPDEVLTEEHVLGYDFWNLQCSTSRMVTSRGVFVCPILIDHPAARMGSTLAETLRAFPLAHGACHTCWATGASCRN
ncbi:MAG TPA: radical SAM protein [Candidatus Eisenbacteria bacterium]|nr:radical SAM protein [Candidatus Eisenbacteria bacterium]